jgi:hypothetical protein
LSAIEMLLSGHPTLPLSESISARALDKRCLFPLPKTIDLSHFGEWLPIALCLAGHRMGGLKSPKEMAISSQFFLPALESCRTASPLLDLLILSF